MFSTVEETIIPELVIELIQTGKNERAVEFIILHCLYESTLLNTFTFKSTLEDKIVKAFRCAGLFPTAPFVATLIHNSLLKISPLLQDGDVSSILFSLH